jgi:hypothetical protein
MSVATSPRTIAVERAEWSAVLNEFSARHAGWLVSIDILSGELGAQPACTDLPLASIECEAANGAIVIGAGRTAADHLTHVIAAPVRLWLERTDAGADVALGIESADDVKTIVRLRTAALPETVDGWCP